MLGTWAMNFNWLSSRYRLRNILIAEDLAVIWIAFFNKLKCSIKCIFEHLAVQCRLIVLWTWTTTWLITWRPQCTIVIEQRNSSADSLMKEEKGENKDFNQKLIFWDPFGIWKKWAMFSELFGKSLRKEQGLSHKTEVDSKLWKIQESDLSGPTNTTFFSNNYIGADNTSQTLIEFHCYNPHPYQRTTRTTKNFNSPVIFHHIKAVVGQSINVWKRVKLIPHLHEHRIDKKITLRITQKTTPECTRECKNLCKIHWCVVLSVNFYWLANDTHFLFPIVDSKNCTRSVDFFVLNENMISQKYVYWHEDYHKDFKHFSMNVYPINVK